MFVGTHLPSSFTNQSHC